MCSSSVSVLTCRRKRTRCTFQLVSTRAHKHDTVTIETVMIGDLHTVFKCMPHLLSVILTDVASGMFYALFQYITIGYIGDQILKYRVARILSGTNYNNTYTLDYKHCG